MRAVGYQKSLPIDEDEALVDIEVDDPEPFGRDLLVAVKAISVNPVDTKVRRHAAPEVGAWKILGFDAAGIVVATGPDASLFKPGDAVFLRRRDRAAGDQCGASCRRRTAGRAQARFAQLC
ncbi:alcohol dehydrogenase catalytic domain-containing protein [Methylocella silvestris]|uniref:alcohol dehydrogenase catalytic domain-containing protein n=1 Tax=Methylocella silvestris TaxID=199596 RepID=UPI00030CF7F6